MPVEGMTPTAGAPPQGGAPPPPGQPPGGAPPGQATGATPASTPTPNRGIEAAALAKIAVLTTGLQMLLPMFPVGSDISRDVREAVNKLAKHVPPGAVSLGVQMTEAQRALMQTKQQAPQIAAQRAAQTGQPPAGGAPPPMPAAA